MTKATGIGRGGRKAGGRPASGLTSAMVGVRISISRMQSYKKYLSSLRGSPVTEKDVVSWVRNIFNGELAQLDGIIDGLQLK